MLILCLGISIGTAIEGNNHVNDSMSNMEIVGDTTNTDNTTNIVGGGNKRKTSPDKDKWKKTKDNTSDKAKGQENPPNNVGSQKDPNLSPQNTSSDEESFKQP